MRLAIDARKAYDGGIGRYIRCLTAALLEADPALSVALLMPEAMAAFAPGHASRVVRIDHAAGLYSLEELLGTAGRVARSGADLFHEPHYVLPFRVAVPRIVTIHDTIHARFPQHLGGPVQRRYAAYMLRSAARRADHVLTVSESARRDVIAHAGCEPAHVTSIPLGVEPAFLDVPEVLGARARRTLAIDAPFILYVGAFKFHKNPIGLCDAFAAAALPADALLVLAGSGGEAVAAWRRARGLEGRVRVVEADDETLRGLYREARLFVLPSLYEGFGLPLLEAMAAGTPAIASRVASIPEVGGDVALYVPPGDVGALARALEVLWADAPRRAEMGAAGRARARTFTWRRTAERTLETYRRVLCGVAASR